MEPSSTCSIPVSVDVDMLLMTNRQPGQMEPSPKGQTPVAVDVEPLLIPSGHPAHMELLPNIQTATPFNMQLQQLSTNPSFVQVGASPKFQSSVSAIGSQQLSFRNKQSIQREQSPKAHGSSSSMLALQQPLSINEPSVRKDPALKVQTFPSSNKGSKQLSSISKLVKMESLPKIQSATSPTLGTPQLSSKNKRKSQAEKLPKVQSINLGTQVASPTNRRAAHAESSPKVPSESFESVRSKLRESLAAALALVSDAKKFSQAARKITSSVETNTQGETAAGASKQDEIGSVAGSGSSCSVFEIPSETMRSKTGENDIPLKPDESHCLSSETFTNGSVGDYAQMWKCDMQDFELKHISLEGDMPFNNNLMFKDELLQENGLSWASDPDFQNSELKGDSKRVKLSLEETSADTNESVDKTLHLATKIEAELFRLFGGVNKKYKEKGRSLLFNLKDPNNPELRERVFSEEISPERLCSMPAEELASKQLTEWRIAKAEELAQMVVLPESDVGLRRLVKKTHKGEFQVEVERDDTLPVEVAVRANALPYVPTRINETKNPLKEIDHEAQNSTSHSESMVFDNLVTAKKVDLGALHPQDMQDFMVDELKDTEFLPTAVSLHEFMEALDSEPPFENLRVDAEQDLPTKKNVSDSFDSRLNSMPASSYVMNAIPENLESKANIASSHLISKSDKASDSVVTKQDHLHVASADLLESAVDHPDESGSRNISANHSHILVSGAVSELDNSSQGITPKGENVWEGLVQLNVSSLVTVLGIFKSGEKASTKEWPGFLEIKGRVRVDAFEKFLQELPSSRSRAIMVVHFQWKEESPESGRTSLIETADSYVADERVGFAEPAPGVELYFCPPHVKTIQMLEKHIPKEHLEALASTDDGLLGIVVWRRPHVTSAVSPRLSNHKHSSSRKHLVSRKQQNSNADVSKRSAMPPPVNDPVMNPEPHPEEAVDDVPPGFGPRATGDEDDLPEFDFRGTRPMASNSQQASGVGMSHPHGRPLARPREQMRELIHKYGQGEAGIGIPPAGHMQPHIQPWDDDDDDDIPEWQPHQGTQPPLQGLHQQTLPQTNPHLMPVAPPKPPTLTVHAPPQLVPPLAMPMHPTMGMTQVAHGVQSAWQPGAWWTHAHMPVDAGFSPHGPPLPPPPLQPPCQYGGPPPDVQHNGMGGYGNLQNATDWRSDVYRSRDV